MREIPSNLILFGDIIKYKRKKLGLTQAKMAKKIKISSVALSNIERNIEFPSEQLYNEILYYLKLERKFEKGVRFKKRLLRYLSNNCDIYFLLKTITYDARCEIQENILEKQLKLRKKRKKKALEFKDELMRKKRKCMDRIKIREI